MQKASGKKLKVERKDTVAFRGWSCKIAPNSGKKHQSSKPWKPTFVLRSVLSVPGLLLGLQANRQILGGDYLSHMLEEPSPSCPEVFSRACQWSGTLQHASISGVEFVRFCHLIFDIELVSHDLAIFQARIQMIL
jgi:hypothetical protein